MGLLSERDLQICTKLLNEILVVEINLPIVHRNEDKAIKKHDPIFQAKASHLAISEKKTNKPQDN